MTGQDLVAWQLQVAAGQRLPCSQEELVQSGHAIEARVYAEDPAVSFVPQTGRVTRFEVPAAPGLRVDSGVRAGTLITHFYDPLLVKLIVHAEDRPTAVTQLRNQLKGTVLHGIQTNLEYLSDIASTDAFAAGNLDTGFIDQHLSNWKPRPPTSVELAAVGAVLARDGYARRSYDNHDTWKRLGPWRIGPAGGTPIRIIIGEHEHKIDVRGGPGRLEVALGTNTFEVELDHDPDSTGCVEPTVDGTRVRMVLSIHPTECG